MEPRYDPKICEEKIYELWEKSEFFNPDKLPGKRKKKYSITIPPPNVTGSLHMGHALNNTIQDILARYHRMRGEKVLWLPGIDHAGIATQNVVEKEIAKQGLTRHQLGRDKFIEKVWQWKEKYGNLILEQLKKIGCSCDWSRTRFTLDKEYERAVQTAFVSYYKKGYIYRGPRIVNWCPRCATAISDIEVKYQEEKGTLWYVKYPFKNEAGCVTIATTRPETMLGDTAVAVNPHDERYQEIIGKTVILPLVSREIPVISHRLVDPSFGTGALKITPAHDRTDWQIGKENGLETINVIGPDGKMTEQTGKYKGLATLEARKRIVAELKNLDLLEKTEEYEHQISLCDRCQTPIEPQISTQWFVKMEKLAKPAIKAVKKKKIRIFPERYKKTYLEWLDNIEDWCISRQLWWGHRLPIWLCQTANEIKNIDNDYVVSTTKPKQCPFCGHCEMKQSEDVLDTWFSSALWPFATLGWPQKTEDLKEYYPTSLLSTARDIIYLWVARMVFSGMEFLKKIPFKDVYIHATILNLEGRRMSKSLGTGIDPLELIDRYGADATRFGLMLQTNRDQQAIRFDERSILAARNFVNKLWNVSRFIKMQTEDVAAGKFKPLTLADKWILSRLNHVIKSIGKKIENYEFGEATKELYEFVWHELADWYLEISKMQINDSELKENTGRILNFISQTCLRLSHPFLPFVTEEINVSCCQPEMLIISSWPKAKKRLVDPQAEKTFTEIKTLIMEIRNWKMERKVPLKQETEYRIKEENKNLLTENRLKGLVETITKTKLIL